MNISGNTVLITGGGSGIGLALAERFLKAGNQVVICGRRQERLEAARQRFPELQIRVCDVAKEEERIWLCDWTRRQLPGLNVLVNNAGIQHRNVNLTETYTTAAWHYYQDEIATNLEAPMHLSMLFMPLLAGKPNATIINVSSGLAFTPMASVPIYCASKAGLHSFTMSLRHQAKPKQVEVIELIPPAVQTELGGAGIHTHGAPVDEFADAVFARLGSGETEIGYGTAERSSRMSRDEIDQAFERMNNR